MAQQTKEITTIQYARYKGCTPRNINKHIRKGNELPHVIKVNKYSRFILLVVDINLIIPL